MFSLVHVVASKTRTKLTFNFQCLSVIKLSNLRISFQIFLRSFISKSPSFEHYFGKQIRNTHDNLKDKVVFQNGVHCIKHDSTITKSAIRSDTLSVYSEKPDNVRFRKYQYIIKTNFKMSNDEYILHTGISYHRV
jgi:hypothetical protein